MVLGIRKIAICGAIFLITGCAIKPISETTIGPSVLARSLNVQEMALDKDSIFLLTIAGQKQGNNSSNNNKIERVSKKGGNKKTLIEEKLTYSNLILDDKFVYWIAKDKTDPSRPIQYVKSINKNGGEIIDLYQEEDYSFFSITQNSNYIVLFSSPTNNSNMFTIVQINKKDNSIKKLLIIKQK
jgi:hypothetical protein